MGFVCQGRGEIFYVPTFTGLVVSLMQRFLFRAITHNLRCSVEMTFFLIKDVYF